MECLDGNFSVEVGIAEHQSGRFEGHLGDMVAFGSRLEIGFYFGGLVNLQVNIFAIVGQMMDASDVRFFVVERFGADFDNNHLGSVEGPAG